MINLFFQNKESISKQSFAEFHRQVREKPLEESAYSASSQAEYLSDKGT